MSIKKIAVVFLAPQVGDVLRTGTLVAVPGASYAAAKLAAQTTMLALGYGPGGLPTVEEVDYEGSVLPAVGVTMKEGTGPYVVQTPS